MNQQDLIEQLRINKYEGSNDYCQDYEDTLTDTCENCLTVFDYEDPNGVEYDEELDMMLCADCHQRMIKENV